VLEVAHIDVAYGDLQALWDVSLSVERGEIVALIGSNGAGKSTLMRAVSGLLRPRRGTISLAGLRLDTLGGHRVTELGISMVPEGRRLFPLMTVLENLEVGAFRREARRWKDETLAWVYEVFPALKERAGQLAGSLSGGEQQMLAIGRALMSKPKLLLIDEMSLGLSPMVTQELSRVIKSINESQGLTILLVEQNVRIGLMLASRAYVMENGRITGQGQATALLDSPSVREAYLGMRPAHAT
jgi:branched-chain amino acid transport system ATP-binding protein